MLIRSTSPQRSWRVVAIFATALTAFVTPSAAAAQAAKAPAAGAAPAAKGGAPAATSDWIDRRNGHPNFAGYWKFQGFLSHYEPVDDRVLKASDGQVPPLLPGPKKIYDERVQMQRGDEAWADSNTYCLPSGMPRVTMGASYPMQILDEPDQLMFVYESLNEFRYIYLDQPHDVDAGQTWRGDTVGHWEGDTLVAETTGMNDITTIDKIGMPHSTDLKVTERIRLVDPNTLEAEITFDDPKTFARPWKRMTTYKRMPKGTRILEYVCNENNRNTPDASGQTTIQLKDGTHLAPKP